MTHGPSLENWDTASYYASPQAHAVRAGEHLPRKSDKIVRGAMRNMILKLKVAFAAGLCTLVLPGNAQAQVMPFILEDSKWEQIIFPGVGANTISVQQYFEGTPLTPETMFPTGQEWVLYEWEAFENAYSVMEPASLLKPGTGYWIVQATGQDVSITQPNNAPIVGYPYQGCTDRDNTNDDELKDLCTLTFIAGERGAGFFDGFDWRLIGNPGASVIDYVGITIGGLSSTEGRPFADPRWRDEPLVYRWDDAAGNYTALHLRDNDRNEIPPWAGFWIGTSVIQQSPPEQTLAILIPSGLEKNTPQCPAACTDVSAPPPPPTPPESFVEVTTSTDSDSSLPLNDIQTVTIADTDRGFFFTLTAANGANPSMCEVDTQSTTENGIAVKGDQVRNPTTGIDFMACVQSILGSTQGDFIDFDLVPPLPAATIP